MKTRFLEGEQVFLRALEPEDLEFLYSIENDPELWDISCFTVPYSKYLLKQYIAQNQYDIFADKQLRLVIESRSLNVPVGTVDITDYSIQHSRGVVGIAILKEYRNQKLGIEALNLLCNYAFQFLHFHQLYVHIALDNHASIALFENCGFTACGTIKDWLLVGNRWVDVIIMQRIYPE